MEFQGGQGIAERKAGGQGDLKELGGTPETFWILLALMVWVWSGG